MVVKLCSQIAGYVKTSTDRISAVASYQARKGGIS